MTATTRHKGFILFTLIFIILGLLSLGMKLPDLKELASQSRKPAPRPRALTKNQINSCKQLIKKLAGDLPPCEAAVTAILPSATPHFHPHVAAVPSPAEISICVSQSRAPPRGRC